jgi:hypothetical protein
MPLSEGQTHRYAPTKPRVFCACRGEPACSPWLNLMTLKRRVGRSETETHHTVGKWWVSTSFLPTLHHLEKLEQIVNSSETEFFEKPRILNTRYCQKESHFEIKNIVHRF